MARPKSTICPQGHNKLETGQSKRGNCIVCQKAATKKWRTANRERSLGIQRKSFRKSSGIVFATGETKSGVCPLCEEFYEKLYMDHNHVTGRKRGWLCKECNMRLERIENKKWKGNAEKYLDKFCMGKEINIWVDDYRQAPFGFSMWAYTYEEAINFLSMCTNINTLSLDHDLGDTSDSEKTGYNVICWIEERHHVYEYPLPKRILCHSANPVGVRRIQQVIERLYPR